LRDPVDRAGLDWRGAGNVHAGAVDVQALRDL